MMQQERTGAKEIYIFEMSLLKRIVRDRDNTPNKNEQNNNNKWPPSRWIYAKTER